LAEEFEKKPQEDKAKIIEEMKRKEEENPIIEN